jgi:hypothetical protein
MHPLDPRKAAQQAHRRFVEYRASLSGPQQATIAQLEQLNKLRKEAIDADRYAEFAEDKT